MALLTGQAKSKKVAELLKALADKVDDTSYCEEKLLVTLDTLKQYGRNPQNAEALYSEEGISILARYGFPERPTPVSREALRCIANALLLASKLRQVFVDLGLAKKTAEVYKNASDDDEFLTARILFLLTYNTQINHENLLRDDGVALSIRNHLRMRHFAYKEQNFPESKDETPPIPNQNSTAALSESLKLLFNLSNTIPECLKLLQPCLQEIFSLWHCIEVPSEPLQAPFSHLINALVNFDFKDPPTELEMHQKSLFPASDSDCIVDKMIKILDCTIRPMLKPSEHRDLIPLLTVLRKVYEFAPEEVKRHMQSRLLPERQDRDLPLGQSRTLSSRLLRLSTSTADTTVREVLSTLMFELSGNSAQAYIDNVGYGYAAGYLANHNIPMPDTTNSAGGKARDERLGIPVNPITGQRLDKEPVVAEPPMTKEEKEREAERLFVLFERLKATGVVDVKNPLQEAMEKGQLERRIEEVEDDDEDV